MKNYLVLVKIGVQKIRWHVEARDSREAIQKTITYLKFEFDDLGEEITALLVKEIKD